MIDPEYLNALRKAHRISEFGICRKCSIVWPCSTDVLLDALNAAEAERDAARAQATRLADIVTQFLVQQNAGVALPPGRMTIDAEAMVNLMERFGDWCAAFDGVVFLADRAAAPQKGEGR